MRYKVSGSLIFFMISLCSYSQSTPDVKRFIVPIVDKKTVPPNFYTQKLSFFCQQERQLQKATRLPLYIRLGNKEYVDYLERKPNAVRRW